MIYLLTATTQKRASFTSDHSKNHGTSEGVNRNRHDSVAARPHRVAIPLNREMESLSDTDTVSVKQAFTVLKQAQVCVACVYAPPSPFVVGDRGGYFRAACHP